MKRIPASAAAALAASLGVLSGCYIVPVGPDGFPRAYIPVESSPLVAQAQARDASAAPRAAGPALPATMQARLYPNNDAATQTGMVSGTVTNMMTGKGRLQLSYKGELLTGEATRVSGDERKGVANAWGQNGTFMSCDYQMSSPYRGAGTCTFSDGANYQVHIGN